MSNPVRRRATASSDDHDPSARSQGFKPRSRSARGALQDGDKAYDGSALPTELRQLKGRFAGTSGVFSLGSDACIAAGSPHSAPGADSAGWFGARPVHGAGPLSGVSCGSVPRRDSNLGLAAEASMMPHQLARPDAPDLYRAARYICIALVSLRPVFGSLGRSRPGPTRQPPLRSIPTPQRRLRVSRRAMAGHTGTLLLYRGDRI
jgi:hypothetical protein